MIGVIPAAGAGQRIQPLGCSKELLPVGTRQENGVSRPKAVAEYLVERMIAAGAEQICMIISAEKSDIVRYFAERDFAAEIFYAVQRQPRGLCDALFRAEPFASRHDRVMIGLPDTVWFPENGFKAALAPGSFREAGVNLLLFPVHEPQHFDAVITDEQGYVQRVDVKKAKVESHWVWGALTTTGAAYRELRLLWESRHRQDEYLGDLLNASISAGNIVRATSAGEIYMDVGTLEGYRQALQYLEKREREITHSRA